LQEHKSKREEERLFSAFTRVRRFNKWPRELQEPVNPLYNPLQRKWSLGLAAGAAAH